MPRTVEKILKDDEDKAEIGITKEELEQLNVEDDDLVVEGEVAKSVSKGPTAEETIAKLQKQVADSDARAEREAAARKEAEDRALSANAGAATAAQAQVATHEQAIKSKIAAATTNLESIKSQLKQAKATGDSDAEVELQDALTNARYELNTAVWDEKNFANWKANQDKIVKQQNSVSKSPYTAKEQAWIDSHPEFATDKKFARTAKMAAQEALDEGHSQDSKAYFTYIENTMREHGFLTDDEGPLSGAGKNTNAASVAAAPDRTGNRPDQIVINKNSKYPYVQKGFRIPSDWVQAAKDQEFDDVLEYANMRLEDEAKQKGTIQ